MTAAAAELRLPEERFYWAVLDSRLLPRGARARRRGLGYLFESVLPVPIESVHATYWTLSDAETLACGMDREALAALATPGVLTLGPERLPGFIGRSDFDVRRLNLLSGEFEPRAIARARRRTTLVACAAVLLLGVVIAVGQTRRAWGLSGRAESFARATDEIYARVLPPSEGGAPPSARLTAELRSLDRTRGDRSRGRRPEEIAPTMASVLASWPSGLHLTTESLSASADTIALTVRLPDERSAERFERGLTPPAGWRMGQPAVQRERDGITVRVRMEREAAQ